jgi:hypothetical protein
MTIPAWLTWPLVRRVLPFVAAALAIWLAWQWHTGKVESAAKAAAATQLADDRAAFQRAAEAARVKQAKVVAASVAKVEAINERTTHDLQKRTDRIARSYDDLRLRWEKHRAAHPGGTGNDRAAGLSSATASLDAAACAAEGWVSFDVASAAAEAADQAIKKDDAWIAWAMEQQAAWPK